MYILYEYISGKGGALADCIEREQPGAFGEYWVYKFEDDMLSYRLYNNTKESYESCLSKVFFYLALFTIASKLSF